MGLWWAKRMPTEIYILYFFYYMELGLFDEFIFIGLFYLKISYLEI